MDSDEFTLDNEIINNMRIFSFSNSEKKESQAISTITYKTRGVVIPHSLGITIGLQQRVGCNDLVLKRALQEKI